MRVQSKSVILKSGTQVTFRSPEPSDARTVLEHLRINFREAHENMNYPPSFFEKMTEDQEAAVLDEYTQSEDKFMISCFLGDRVIGNIGIMRARGVYARHTGKLGMGVQKAYNNLGVGTALIQYALEVCRSQGISRVELTVRTHNAGGIHLYEKTGFQRIAQLQKVALIDGVYHDEYLYEQILNP